MKIRRSTKRAIRLAATAVGIGAAAFGGKLLWTTVRLSSVKLDPIEASDFCLLAVSKEAGVKVIVANRIAQVVDAQSDFKSDSGGEQGASSGAIKRRIPIKELVQILDGDPRGVHPFVLKLRESGGDEGENESTPIWKFEDIRKALDGDETLKSKLERDLNSSLDGVPSKTLNLDTFPDGIRVATPITLSIENTKGKTLNAFRISEFRPRTIAEFSNFVKEKYYDRNTIQNYWKSFLEEKNPTPQSLGPALADLGKANPLKTEEERLTKIASHTRVLANRSMIQSVSMSETKVDGQPTTYNLRLVVSPEARDRLWKYSSKGETVILVVSKGVAIAAAKIGTELNSQELVVNQITDERLVKDAVDSFNRKS